MKVIIIGAQAAGMTCAMRLHRNKPSYDITVIEKNDYVSFGTCGLPYFIGNFFEDEAKMFAKTPEEITGLGIDLRLNNEVTKVDYQNQKITVKNLITGEERVDSYDKLVIATGSRARKFSFKNEYISTGARKIYDIKSLSSAKDLKSRLKSGSVKDVAILGAGYIGLELLEALREYPNINVTIVDTKEKFTSRLLDDDFESIILEEVIKYNIKILLGNNIREIYEDLNRIYLDTNSKTYSYDILISAIGFDPNVEFVKDLPFDRFANGALIINNKGETNIKHIYACGDVSAMIHKISGQHQYMPFATLANKMGRIIAENISGKNIEFSGAIGSSFLKILDLEVAKVGLAEYELKELGYTYKSAFIEDLNHTDYYPNQHPIYAKLLIDKEGKKILGATLVGKEGAALRAHTLAVAIDKGMAPEELEMLDFAYAPPFNRTWEFLNIAGRLASKR